MLSKRELRDHRQNKFFFGSNTSMGLRVTAQSFYPDAQTTFFKVDELSEGSHIDLCFFRTLYFVHAHVRL